MRDLFRTTLLTTNSNLHDAINHPNILDTMPKREVHSLFLATNSLVQIYQVMSKIRIPLTKLYPATGAIITIIALIKSPTRFAHLFGK